MSAEREGPEQRFSVTSADGVRLACQGWGGAGPINLLLVHGYGQDHRIWAPLAGKAAVWPCAVYSYDLRGHGGSDRPAGPAAYREGERWARDLRAVIEALPRRPTVLVGWSYAGRVVVDYLRAFGERDLAGIALIGASTQDGEGFLAPEIMGMAHTIATGDPVRIEAALAALVPRFFHRPPAPKQLEALLRTARSASLDALRWMNDRPLDGDALLRELRCPFVVLQGLEDRIVLPAMARHMADQVRHARLALLPDIGHVPFLEAPEIAADHLGAWLGAALAIPCEGG